MTVAVDGPGVLQGLGSGNPCTEETFGGADCTTRSTAARSRSSVRPGAGTITVTVTADGCDDRSE